MKKLMISIAVTTSMVLTSSTVCAETKKSEPVSGGNYVLSQAVTKGDNNLSNLNMGDTLLLR